MCSSATRESKSVSWLSKSSRESQSLRSESKVERGVECNSVPTYRRSLGKTRMIYTTGNFTHEKISIRDHMRMRIKLEITIEDS